MNEAAVRSLGKRTNGSEGRGPRVGVTTKGVGRQALRGLRSLRTEETQEKRSTDLYPR